MEYLKYFLSAQDKNKEQTDGWRLLPNPPPLFPGEITRAQYVVIILSWAMNSGKNSILKRGVTPKQ